MTCVDCGTLLFPASPTSPAERRCQATTAARNLREAIR